MVCIFSNKGRFGHMSSYRLRIISDPNEFDFGSCSRLPENFSVQKGNSNVTAEGIFKRSASRLSTYMGMKNALAKL